MEDCGKDGLRVESMMNGECIQSMEEKDDEKKEVRQMLELARSEGSKLNGGYSFIHLTLRMGIHVLGRKSIEQVVIWDQKAEQAVTFVMNGSNLREEAEVWLPSGYGRQESKEELGVEKDGVESTTTVVEEDTSTSTTLGDAGRLVEQKMSQETTAVETMSYERLAEAVDKQKAADDVEADCEKEKGDVSKASEQNVLDKSEADDVETEDKRVQPIHYNGNGGVQAARRKAENIMFHHNLSCLVDSVVEYLVLREEHRKSAKEFLVDLSNKWFESLDSHMQTSECVSAANGWKDCCWAYKDVYLELAEGVGPFKQKYFEDDSGLPLTNKKMVHWMCKGFYITCTEMSSMCHGFAYAEENDRWKSWESSDEYLELLTLRRAERC